MGGVIGGGKGRLPPMHPQDVKTLLNYLLREEHILKLWGIFVEKDSDCNGIWTSAELYGLIQEPRLSMRAPIIDALFWMGDANSQGALAFQDFCVTFVAFCALSKEEILQLFFIIVDRDRNGHIEKQELLQYFSYAPDASNKNPIFPLNNKNALDQFKGGRWASLEFDGLAQLCERFPYICYPAYHVQEMYRHKLLGARFWDRVDDYRSRYHRTTAKKKLVRVPGTREKVEMLMPGRCTMQELLEFSRRKTAVRGGKRINAEESKHVISDVTAERDVEIARCPILTMIRNPRCMYYVPRPASDKYAQPAKPDLELPEFALDTSPEDESKTRNASRLQSSAGFRVVSTNQAWEGADDSESDDGMNYSSGSSSDSEG